MGMDFAFTYLCVSQCHSNYIVYKSFFTTYSDVSTLVHEFHL